MILLDCIEKMIALCDRLTIPSPSPTKPDKNLIVVSSNQTIKFNKINRGFNATYHSDKCYKLTYNKSGINLWQLTDHQLIDGVYLPVYKEIFDWEVIKLILEELVINQKITLATLSRIFRKYLFVLVAKKQVSRLGAIAWFEELTETVDPDFVDKAKSDIVARSKNIASVVNTAIAYYHEDTHIFWQEFYRILTKLDNCIFDNRNCGYRLGLTMNETLTRLRYSFVNARSSNFIATNAVKFQNPKLQFVSVLLRN